jgi:hypothetical protein
LKAAALAARRSGHGAFAVETERGLKDAQGVANAEGDRRWNMKLPGQLEKANVFQDFKMAAYCAGAC